MRRFILIPSLVLALASSAAARTWYVPGDADSIQAGIDSAGIGDTVLVADGVWRGPGNRDLDFRGKDLVLQSESDDPSTCIIDCEGRDIDGFGIQRGFLFHSGETRHHWFVASQSSMALGRTQSDRIAMVEGSSA
ncbi:hypothetical protein ACFL6M_05225 [Candidatus Eisenbacteria bacterium]|uniref:Uncharacterized protein n=1 Tax=Eiseniibacteriota bacterium TaxID=2212470 RepID=A0ABV6YKY4_UNCEI